jgi:hypothetical protein
MATDTSKEYIELVDCPEIQDAWEPKEGDWFALESIDGYDTWCCFDIQEGNIVFMGTRSTIIPIVEKESQLNCIYLPDIRWYMEHIPEFEKYSYSMFWNVGGKYWSFCYQIVNKPSKQIIVTGKTWEQCFCKMYLKEVHGKGGE